MMKSLDLNCLSSLEIRDLTGSPEEIGNADAEKNIRNLHIANFVGGLLLGAATASIAVAGTASALPFVAVVISLGGLSYSLLETYKAGREIGILEGGVEYYNGVSSGKEELIKGVKYAFAGFVSGVALKLLLAYFVAAKPVASTQLPVASKYHTWPYPNPYSI